MEAKGRYGKRGLLIRLAALLCLCLATGEAQAQSESIVPPAGSWGRAPGGEPLEQRPELLPYRGWCRFTGRDGGSLLASSADSLLLRTSGERSYRVNPADGSRDWTAPAGDYGRIYQEFAQNWLLSFSSYGADSMGLFSTLDGRWLWQREDLTCLSFAGDSLWAGRPLGTSMMHNWFTSGIELLDGGSGESLAEFSLSELRGLSYGDSGPAGGYIVKTDSAYLLLEQDGSQRELLAADPAFKARILMFPGGFLCVESELDPYDLDDFERERRGEEGYPELSEEVWEAWDPGPVRLSCYSLPDAGLRWSMEFDREEYEYLDCDSVNMDYSGERLLLEASGELLLLKLPDGSALPGSAKLDQLQEAERQLRGQYCYALRSNYGNPPAALLVLDMDSGELREFSLGQLPAREFQLGPSWLAFSSLTGGWDRVFDANGALYCLALDEAGLPVPGEMQALDFPDEHAQLIEDFLATAEPLADELLMRRIMRAGSNALLRLVEACPLDDESHMDALAACVAYISDARTDEDERVLAAFVDILSRRAEPALVPALQRWQADPGLQMLQPSIGTLLAHSGGTEAAALLGSAQLATGVRHEAPAGPFQLVPQASMPSGFGPFSKEVQPAGCTDSAGRSWSAFFGDGLLSATVIYIALDSDSDGLYEQLWPTALRQCFDYGLYEREDPDAPLSGLQLECGEGESVMLTYLRAGWDPALGPEEHGWGADFAEETLVTLTIAELETDSDGDGLSDNAEKLLKTDPQLADTDGDGTGDAEDGAPLSNPDWMGPSERGVARALDYFFREYESGNYSDWWAGSYGNPWQARYLDIYGAGPVDYVARPGTWSIFVNPGPMRSWEEGPETDPAEYTVAGDEQLDLNWMQAQGTLRERYIDYCARRGLEPSRDEREMIIWASHYAYYYEDEAEITRMLDSPQQSESWTGFDPDEADAALSIDFHGVGYIVFMKLVEGEYYPISASMTWVS